MLEFNVGEVVTRLRIALGVRGRMPLGLDEVVIPTIRVEDLGRPPFRVQPVEFHGYVAVTTAAATAGRQARVACALNAPIAGTVAVIRRYRVQVSSFVTATGALDPAMQGWDLQLYNGPTSNLVAVQVAQTTERYAAAALNGTNTDVQMLDNAGTLAPPVLTTVAIDGGNAAPGGLAPWVDCNIPLYNNLGIFAETTVISTATSQCRIALSVQGEIYSGFTLPV